MPSLKLGHGSGSILVCTETRHSVKSGTSLSTLSFEGEDICGYSSKIIAERENIKRKGFSGIYGEREDIAVQTQYIVID